MNSAKIGNGDTSIGSYAFQYCSSLNSLTIGNGATSIGSDAFFRCYSLNSVTIGNGITSIGSDAFYDCSSLNSVYITDLSAWCKIKFSSNSNPLCNGAKLYLSNNELTELVIPTDITQINSYAFAGCKSLKKVTINDGVTSLGSYAFYQCSSLTSATIGNGITSIGSYTFSGCSSLISATIGNSITSIGSYAFYNCSSLTDFYCYATTPPKTDVNSTSYMTFPFYKDQTYLHVPARCETSYKSSRWGTYFQNIVEMD